MSRILNPEQCPHLLKMRGRSLEKRLNRCWLISRIVLKAATIRQSRYRSRWITPTHPRRYHRMIIYRLLKPNKAHRLLKRKLNPKLHKKLHNKLIRLTKCRKKASVLWQANNRLARCRKKTSFLRTKTLVQLKIKRTKKRRKAKTVLGVVKAHLPPSQDPARFNRCPGNNWSQKLIQRSSKMRSLLISKSCMTRCLNA